MLIRLTVAIFDGSVASDFSGLCCYLFRLEHGPLIVVPVSDERLLFHRWHSVCTMPMVVVISLLAFGLYDADSGGCGSLSSRTSRIIVYNYWNIYIPFNHDDKLIS